MTTEEQTQFDELQSRHDALVATFDDLTKERDALTEKVASLTTARAAVAAQVEKLTADVVTAAAARDVFKAGMDKQARQLIEVVERNRVLKAAQPVIRERIQAKKDLDAGHPVAVAAADAPDAA